MVTYFHPHDLDPAQLVLRNLSATRRFKSDVGISGAIGNIEKPFHDISKKLWRGRLWSPG